MISEGISILYKLGQYVSKNTIKMLYHAYIQPHIDYSLIVWGSATKSKLKIIQDKMKKTIRTISFKKSNPPNRISVPRTSNSKLQKNLQTACFMWKLSNNESPGSLNTFK